MKNIAVICNNFVEWKHFVDTLQFTLSKDNKPYKVTCARKRGITTPETIVDIEKQVKYLYVLNHVSGIDGIRGYLWCNYITMGKQIDKDLENWIKLHMRGE